MSKQPAAKIRPESYAHSPAHFLVARGDHSSLTRLVSSLPKLPHPDSALSESDSLHHERIADEISTVLDRRDVPFRETPLHLAVRLNDAAAARILAGAGADVSLHNSAGWSPLQEALCRRATDVAAVLVRYHHISAWLKWRRRLPRLIAVLRRMRDFYMEIQFHFESSIVPFIGKIAPSDTYKIWKRDGNVRADTSLAGFDGMKIQRADQSFLFLGDGDLQQDVAPGSLLVLNHDDRKIYDAFENAGAPLSDAEIAGMCSQTSVYRPGMDVTRAELVSRTNWRRQEKTETIGEWKSKVYEIHNVVFSFRSRKVSNSGEDVAGSEQILPLELDEDDDGYLAADLRRHSSFIPEEREWISVGRKSVDINFSAGERRRPAVVTAAPAPATKEKEYVKSLRPSVWLTEEFPLKVEEVLPLLDILANRVKAVRRMRELLTTKFPPRTFPVKIAIPVVPTVRVVITFTKFIELQPTELFYTPMSSPRHLTQTESNEPETRSTWLRRSTSRRSSSSSSSATKQCPEASEADPFVIPSGYSWESIDNSKNNRKLKKSKSVRRSK